MASVKKKLTRRISSSKKGDQKKNPYSDLGVDKFTALLAEVEEKKRAIYSQLDPDEEVSLIRFVPAGGSNLKPVVVRAPSNKGYKYKPVTGKVEDLAVADEVESAGIKKVEEEEEEGRVLKVEIRLPPIGMDKIPAGYYLLGGMVILVVVLMALFGR